jgi:hypothetical protein
LVLVLLLLLLLNPHLLLLSHPSCSALRPGLRIMHRGDLRRSSGSRRRFSLKAVDALAATLASSRSLQHPRGRHWHRSSSSSSIINSNDAIEGAEGDWCTKHHGIPLKHKRALVAFKSTSTGPRRSLRKPLTKIVEDSHDEDKDQGSAVVTTAVPIVLVDSQGFLIPQSSSHDLEEPEIEEVVRTNSNKTRMDSVRVLTQDNNDVLLVQVPHEEAVEVVSLCIDEHEESTSDGVEDMAPLFMSFAGEIMPQDDAAGNDTDNQQSRASLDKITHPLDKYQVKLLEDEGDDTDPLLGKFPLARQLSGQSDSWRSTTGISVSEYYNSISGIQDEKKTDDDLYSVQTEPTGFGEDDSQCYSVQSQAMSRASTVSRLYYYSALNRQPSSQSEAFSQFGNGSTDDTDDDRYAAGSDSVYSMFSEDTTDSYITAASTFTRSLRSELSAMAPVTLSVSEEFKEMAKELTRNPGVLAQWLNPL